MYFDIILYHIHSIYFGNICIDFEFSFPGYWGELGKILEGGIYFYDLFAINILAEDLKVKWKGSSIDYTPLLSPIMVRLLTEDPMKHDFHGQYEIEIPDLEVDE